MKTLLNFSFLLILVLVIGCKKDQDTGDTPIVKGTIIDTMDHDGIPREYLVYVPQAYNGKEKVPLFFNFHPSGGNLSVILPITKYDQIAERENFIFVSPLALEDNTGKRNWNVDRLAAPDDVGFVSALIDVLSARYNIDAERVYASGYSQGAFFSFTLACDLDDKIAAIAGVAGYMSYSYLNQCDVSRPMPVLQIHGTKDLTVPYSGVSNSLDFWIAHDQASTTPVITDLPDLDPGDNSTVQHYLYADGNQGCTIEHLKVIDGPHGWPGEDVPNSNQDIDSSEEIWKFVSRYDINGKRN